jgi:hypothetical protein
MGRGSSNEQAGALRAQIPLREVVYIAEGAMERGGMTGRDWYVPDVHRDNPEKQVAERALAEFASEAYLAGGGTIPRMWDGSDPPEGVLPVRVVASDWLDHEGGPGTKASASRATMSITVRHQTNDLTILHEVAHLLVDPGDADDGHTPEFVRCARMLYERFISPEAAEVFWRLLSHRVDG